MAFLCRNAANQFKLHMVGQGARDVSLFTEGTP